MNKEYLIRKIFFEAKKLGLPPDVVTAQAILETGFFKSMPYNNIFGIKATKKDIEQKKYFITKTTEYNQNQKQRLNLAFRKFNTINEAINRYYEIIKKNFPFAYKNKNNRYLYISGLTDYFPKYATDPYYKKKILKLADYVNKYVNNKIQEKNNNSLINIIIALMLIWKILK